MSEPLAFPKWVEPHPSHVVTTGGHVSLPEYPDFHIDRDGKVTVLVASPEEEARATAGPVEQEVHEPSEVQEPEAGSGSC